MTITDLPIPNLSITESSPSDSTPAPGRLKQLELPCQSGDADLWFVEDPADLEAAKALCVQCPLQRPCLAEAVDRGEPWGVWGGEIFDRGVVIARKRPRGRPRKNA